MYICVCKAVTDGDIRQNVQRGEVSCMQSLRERLGAATGCGGCEQVARSCLDAALAEVHVSGSSQPIQPNWEGGSGPGCPGRTFDEATPI